VFRSTTGNDLCPDLLKNVGRAMTLCWIGKMSAIMFAMIARVMLAQVEGYRWIFGDTGLTNR